MKILVGYDGTNSAKEALEVAKKHAKAFNASVHIINSMTSGTENQQKKIDAAEEELSWAKSTFADDGIPVETHLLIRGLSAGEDIVQFAEENDIEEIVVGVKRRSRVGKMLLGSTAQFVIINAPCVVTTVK